MTSNDNQQYITAELYNTGNDRLERRIIQIGEKQDSSFQALKAEIQNVKDIALVNSAKIDAYRDFTGIWFTVIAVIVALIGFMATVAPFLREIYRDAKKHEPKETLTEEKVQSMINDSIAQTLGKLGR